MEGGTTFKEAEEPKANEEWRLVELGLLSLLSISPVDGEACGGVDGLVFSFVGVDLEGTILPLERRAAEG